MVIFFVSVAISSPLCVFFDLDSFYEIQQSNFCYCHVCDMHNAHALNEMLMESFSHTHFCCCSLASSFFLEFFIISFLFIRIMTSIAGIPHAMEQGFRKALLVAAFFAYLSMHCVDDCSALTRRAFLNPW